MREDHKLQAAVLERLDLDPSINSSHIGVAVQEGVISLSGHVPSLIERSQAERVAGRVKGVRAVINGISVELPGLSRTSDEALAQLAYARLSSNSSIPSERLHLAVKDGVITVHGDVDWPFQVHAALKDLHRLNGVREVRSDVEIRPPVKAERVQDKIRQAIEQIAPLDAQRIFVAAEGSDVVLTGAVNSWHEKGMAESAAWCVPGVTKVTNNILVL